jgi:TP901 family phage tail tape measure protein
VPPESNVGLRLLILGKDGVVAGIREITTATANLNREIAAGAKASKTAAAGYAEQGAGLEALQAKMGAYETQLGTVNAETDALARLGKVAFLGLAAAGAVWTVESIKWAQNYQTELVRLRTQAGLTATAMNQVGTAAMRNAAALGTTPTAYLQAAYHPASTGMSTRQIISITNYAAMASAMSGAPLEDTTNAVTATMKAYGYKGSGERTTALLNAVVGAGNMRFADLNSALSSGIASTAKTFGVSLPSVGGALARLTDIGTPAAQAGTRLRMALALLGGPSSQSDKFLAAAGLDTSQRTAAQSSMASALVKAGLTTTQLSGALRDNSGSGGIYNALELLHSHLQGLSPEAQSALISRAFGGGRMGTSIMQLYGNLPALQQKSGQINRNSTDKKFMSDWAQTTQTLNFQLHRLGGELETIGTAFGKDVLPGVTEGIKLFTDFLTVVGKNKALVIGLGTAVTAVLVPAIGLYLQRALLSSSGSIMSVLRAYRRLILGQSAEEVALGRMDASLVANDAALRTNAGALYGDEAAGTGVGGAKGLKALLGGVAGKAGLGALTASIVAPLLNQYAGPQLKKALGGRGKTDAMDALTGAMLGMYFGPEGAAVGAGLGALYGERGHLGSDLKNLRHGVASGFDYDRHQFAHIGADVRHDAAHWLDDINPFGGGGGGGGGGSSTPRPVTLPQGVIRNQVQVFIDGRQVAAAVQRNLKKTAFRK